MEGPAEKPADWDLPFYYRWMPKISLRGYHVFVEYVASPVWNYLIVPFYTYTMGPVYNNVLELLGYGEVSAETIEIIAENTEVTVEL
jgi:hypothetical protein